ncbi:MAG: hypothetical protein CMM07_24055 [Rhodopirellula sp.]|nr:hypothetical protein [Rhodopirellula sp.]
MVWLNRVEAYLDDLEVAADELARQMKQMKVDQVPASKGDATTSGGIDGSLAVGVNAATERLASCLSELEGKVAHRERLLRAADAPESGLTLSEKLEAGREPRSRSLYRRCETISEMMADINNHALSLFVCQFHLANLTDDVVRLMAGVSEPTTYGDSRKPDKLGGNLFNESA